MTSIKALSVALDVRDWLANSQHPRILHIFDQVCNLINERGEVLSIVSPQIGNGPFNLVIEDDVFFSRHLSLESPISISQNQLTLADLTINTADAKLWNPRPDWEKLYARKDEMFNRLTTTPMPDHQPSIPNSLALRIGSEQASDLSSALTKADISTAKTVASQLAGLGQGLTPAGDDFIMGALYAAWIIHPLEVAKPLVEEVANTAAPLTTSLSAAWLRSAGKGQAGVLWHDFFDVVIAGNSAQIPLQITKLLSVGETSGADALSGFLGTFMCWGERSCLSSF